MNDVLAFSYLLLSHFIAFVLGYGYRIFHRAYMRRRRLVEYYVGLFKTKAELVIKQEVEKLTIDGIRTMRDLAKVRDEYRIYISWNGEDLEIEDGSGIGRGCD